MIDVYRDFLAGTETDYLANANSFEQAPLETLFSHTSAGGGGTVFFSNGDDDTLINCDPRNSVIDLGDGNDFLRNHGQVAGPVYMGDGNDRVLLADGGNVAGLVDLGAGNDLIQLNGGTVKTIKVGDGFNTVVFYEWPDDVPLPKILNTSFRDTIRSAIDFTLETTGVRLLYLILDDDIDGTGNRYANNMFGNSGDNTLYGLGGRDRIDGRGGDDIIYGGDDRDFLGDNFGNNELYGEGGNDVIRTFGSGDNLLSGGEGNDVINGGSGNDILIGGTGADNMRGGAGNDIFLFEAEDVAFGFRDNITDFGNGDDLIDLSNAFEGGVGSFIGADQFSGLGGAEIRAFVGSRSTILYIDSDGDGESDFQINLLEYTDGITVDDFVLV